MSKTSHEERVNVYAQAVGLFGPDTQITVAIEELSELTKELCKVRRGKIRLASLVEEIADVHIMLEQLRFMFSITSFVDEAVDAKVERLAGTIEKERRKHEKNNYTTGCAGPDGLL